ncbi:MAG: hypothetical protein HYU52_04570 [Acidobacteria bacterium]|nr:hypothetical protein [Acidobacteriota bacterium]
MRLAHFVLISAIAFLLLAACATTGGPEGVTPVADPPVLPERAADIRGTITRIMAANGDEPLRILVEADAAKDVVTISPATVLYRDEAGTMRPVSSAELGEGMTVSAWYDGAVKESYPRQATAVAVVIDGGR